MSGSRFGTWTGRGFSLAAALMLGGCTSLVTGIYGDAQTSAPPAAQPVSGPQIVQFDPAAECPQINVPAGASSWSSSKGGGDVRYEATIAQFARECVLNPGNEIAFHIGVEGRVLLGEHGGSGTYSAPLRIAIRDRSGAYIYNQVHNVSVAIPPGDSQGTFRIIDDTAHVVIDPTTPLAGYDIEVGFGGAGAGPGPVKHKKHRG